MDSDLNFKRCSRNGNTKIHRIVRSLFCLLKSLKYQVIKEKLTNKQTDKDVMNFKMRGTAQDSGQRIARPRPPAPCQGRASSSVGTTQLIPRTSTFFWKPTCT